MVVNIICLFTFLSSLCYTALASVGDQQPDFKECVGQCAGMIDGPSMFQCDRRPWSWSCVDECRYLCMHYYTEQRALRGKPVVQYFGKWPFDRLWFMQEPASVLFSLLNLVAHWQCFWLLKKNIPRHYQPYRWLLLLNAAINMNSWLWSCVFHTRDLPWTERMDYFGAMSVLLFGLYMAVYRLARLDRRSSVWTWLWTASAVIFYLLHVRYLLSRDRFDYDYNMKAGITVGMIHNLLWIIFCVRHWRERSYAKTGLFAIVSIMLAMSLEVLDFPPWWGAVDAHALWHLATAPLVYVWYSFSVQDAKYQSRYHYITEYKLA